jgi:hypothetical protein
MTNINVTDVDQSLNKAESSQTYRKDIMATKYIPE